MKNTHNSEERGRRRARERLPFSDSENKENNEDQENFLVPQTPSNYKTPKHKPSRTPNNNNHLSIPNIKPRSPLMAKQLPVALDDTCE